MSDTESSSSGESEDINKTGLVATRARRGNAGNLYESLRAHLDDEDLQKELLAEDEADDAESYEGSDAEDEDNALDSSSDEEDSGPPQEGQAEDLAGEKELLRAERAENNRKRKIQASKLTIPAWHKSVKKVKLANEATADDGSSSPIEPTEKKKKKHDRSERGLLGADAPKRQSIRSSAIVNREVTHANLQEHAERARKQRATLQDTVKRERANKRAELTLEQRLEKCKRIEKETARELGRFEREEAERERLREEALLAKRRRALVGPVIKTITTSGYYENGKLKISRLEHGSQNVDEILEKQKIAAAANTAAISEEDSIQVQGPAAQIRPMGPLQSNSLAADGSQQETVQDSVVHTEAMQSVQRKTSIQADAEPQAPADVVTPLESNGPTQDATSAALTAPTASLPLSSTTAQIAQVEVKVELPPGDPQAEGTPSYPPSMSELLTPDRAAQQSVLQLLPYANEILPSSPAPVIREQAQRSLLILESFEGLDAASTKRSKTASALEPTAVARVLLPDSYPVFDDEQATYLLKKARKQKQELLVKPRCALTTWAGKYRDPKTGVIFADVPSYKMLQRMIAGGCTWNSMLECWTGPSYGVMGRPARGVPEGFDAPVAAIQ